MSKNKRYSYETAPRGGIKLLHGTRVIGRLFMGDVSVAERIVRNLNIEEAAKVAVRAIEAAIEDESK